MRFLNRLRRMLTKITWFSFCLHWWCLFFETLRCIIWDIYRTDCFNLVSLALMELLMHICNVSSFCGRRSYMHFDAAMRLKIKFATFLWNLFISHLVNIDVGCFFKRLLSVVVEIYSKKNGVPEIWSKIKWVFEYISFHVKVFNISKNSLKIVCIIAQLSPGGIFWRTGSAGIGQWGRSSFAISPVHYWRWTQHWWPIGWRNSSASCWNCSILHACVVSIC